MKILFVGFGSIAKKHLEIIKKIDTSAKFFSISRDQKKLNQYGITQIKNSEIKKMIWMLLLFLIHLFITVKAY